MRRACDWQAVAGNQKLSLLIELEGFHEALALIEALDARGVESSALLHAQALLGAGRTEEARAKYGELSEQQWNRKDVMRRLFYLDVASGDRAKAISLGVLASLFAVYATFGLTHVVTRALELDSGTAPPLGVGLSTQDMLRAVLHVYGPWVMLPLVAVIVPIWEELVFRSVLLGAAERNLPFGWANAAQASVFALAHDEPVRYPNLFVMAFAAGVMTRRAGGIAPAIALHASMNFIAAAALWLLDVAPLSLIERTQRESTSAQNVAPTSPDELRAHCQQGDAVACAGLASALERSGAEHDMEQAVTLYTQACDRGVARNCHRLAQLHVAGSDVEQSYVAAVELARKACDGGEAAACSDLGVRHERAQGVAEDLGEGRAPLQAGLRCRQ